MSDLQGEGCEKAEDIYIAVKQGIAYTSEGILRRFPTKSLLSSVILQFRNTYYKLALLHYPQRLSPQKVLLPKE